jgi:hypothetical protein
MSIPRAGRIGPLLGLFVASVAAAGLEAAVDAALRTAKQIYVATQRADGSRSAAAPVWFMYDDGAVYFSTGVSSHKAKRLRRGGRAWVNVGAPDGPGFEGWGQVVNDPERIDRMAGHYRQKYWIAWLGFFVPNRERVAAGKTVIIRIAPGAAPAPDRSP